MITDFVAGDNGDRIAFVNTVGNPFVTGQLAVKQQGPDTVIEYVLAGVGRRPVIRLANVDSTTLTPFNLGGFGFPLASRAAPGWVP